MAIHGANHVKPLMVNLWAPPGVGKSTTAAMVFNVLKFKGVRAELSLEFAKDLTYEQNWKAFQDQFFVSAMQERRNSRLIGECDVIVTDSPPGLGCIYAASQDLSLLRDLVVHWRARYRNMDFRLQRNPEGKPYQQYGRTQTEQESTELEKVLDREMGRLVDNVIDVEVSHLAAHEIADKVIRRLSRERS